jgi:hypothetical protein
VSRETVRARLEWLVFDPATMTDEMVAIAIGSTPGRMVRRWTFSVCRTRRPGGVSSPPDRLSN